MANCQGQVVKGFVYPYVPEDPLCPATAESFPVLKHGGAGVQQIPIPPGHILTPHSHPNSAETTYCLDGEGTVGIITPDATASEPIGSAFNCRRYAKGDVVFLPQGSLHYFANTSASQDLVLLLTFTNPDFDILTLADILRQLPANIREAAAESKDQSGSSPVIPYQGDGGCPSSE